MTNYNKIRERLRHLSENKACSTREIAKKAGIEPSNMLKMLKGQQTITAKTLKKISAAYGISEEWLRTGNGKPENQFKDKNKMEIKIKKLRRDAVMPMRAHATDAGFDLTAVSRVFDCEGNVTYGTGLAFDIPEGYVGLIFPRSSICKKDLALSNAVGCVDSGYHGEVMAKFRPTLVVCDKGSQGRDGNDYLGTNQTDWETQFVTFHGRDGRYPDIEDGALPFQPRLYEVGERIAQLIVMPIPQVEFVEVDDLGESERGTGGYGSSGL